MAKVSLRAYNREIENMIEQGNRLEEAVAHCRHILSIYPKHLETYRLLGKAFLEGKQYSQAIDVFQRVLLAAPEDFVSHVGMSIIADDQGKLDEAIWHMERAFEVQPSNAAIQAELQRLFGRRDGVEPPKIRLTRGALAHMYVQGELYTQAISEIRAVLAHDQNRPDLQVLLARAYFRNGQKAEATEVCTSLLASSPYCLDANRLMAEIFPGAEPTDANREYRRRVSEMDPYAEFAEGSVLGSEAVPESAVTLQRLESIGQSAVADSALGLDLAAARGSMRDDTSPPTWLISQPEFESPTRTEEPRAENLPDFMRKDGWREVSPALSEAEGLGETATGADATTAPADLPEWVRALAPSDDIREISADQESTWQSSEWPRQVEAAASPPSMDADRAGGAEEDERWLRDLAREADRSTDGRLALGWREPSKEAVPARDERDLDTTRGADDALAWLEGLAEEHETSSDELPTSPEERAERPPAYPEGAVPEGWVPVSDVSAAQEGFPRDATTEGAAGEKTFDWLGGLSDQASFAGIEEQPATEQPPIMEEREAAWPTQERGVPSGEAPKWLGRPDATTKERGSAIARESLGEYERGEDLPDWLAGLESDEIPSPEAARPSSSAEALPEWLGAEAESESELKRAVTLGPGEEDAGAMAAQQEAAVGGDARELEQAGGPVTEPARSGEPLPGRTRPVAAASILGAPALGVAKAELGRGNIAVALDQYGRLIRRGKSLEEIIRDLRDALYRYPVEVPIWQALGDAYMRANRLQEALDAYTKAEELLR